MAKIKITQTGSPIRRDKTQRATLVGLGPRTYSLPARRFTNTRKSARPRA